MTTLTLFVPGRPAAQGSKRHVGHGRMLESSRPVGPWRDRAALFAHNAMLEIGAGIITTAAAVELSFVMPRPVATSKRRTPPAVKKPDLDKCIRAVFDALTGVVLADDSRRRRARAQATRRHRRRIRRGHRRYR
jgi:crossover junction endodeoxyribonuclease RusA